MLARTPVEYLTAAQLGIRPIELEYLSRFVAEGKLGLLIEQKHTFNMCTFFDGSGKCGTVGCIAGTMEMYARKDGRLAELSRLPPYDDEECSEALLELFIPEEYALDAIDLPAAVACAENFLATGAIEWGRFL